MTNSKYWTVTYQGANYSAKINGIKLELTKDCGTKEFFGGKQLLARHFLNKEKWQAYVLEVFGDVVFNEIFNLLQEAQSEFENRD